MQVSGIGRVIFWGGGNLWIGLAVEPVPLHSHHAIQIAFGFDAPVEFRPDSRAPWTPYRRGVLIRPNVFHEFKAPGRQVANILFEPESSLGRALLERHLGGPIVALDDNANSLAAAYDQGAEDGVLIQEAMLLVSRLAGGTPPARPTDPRVLRVIEWVGRHLDEPISLADAATVAGLSESRLRHLFVHETGIAFRPYVLWTRLNRALALGFGGVSLDRGGPRDELRRFRASDAHVPANVWARADIAEDRPDGSISSADRVMAAAGIGTD